MLRGQSGINCLLAIYKPKGLSSHDVVAKVRRALHEKRVGHAGTLDPLAEGVLVVGVGQATKLMGHLTLDTKSYIAKIVFGSETDTEDAEGSITRVAEVPSELFDTGYAKDLIQSFIGKQKQVPPSYSAISIGGKRAYAIARSGQEVKLDPRDIEVYQAELINIETEEGYPAWTVTFSVRKGTYIRSLARDLGRRANSAAHLSSLLRSASGSIGLSDCVSLSELEQNPKSVIESSCLDPKEVLGLESFELGEREFERISHGKTLKCSYIHCTLEENTCVSLIYKDALVGIYKVTGDTLKPVCNVLQGVLGVKVK